jgi:hypothetical protein
MPLRMSKKLKFWVEIELQNRQSSEKRLTLIKDVLAEFEAAGEAYRRRRRDGRVIWKPSKQMLRRLADAEREAKADLEDQL